MWTTFLDLLPRGRTLDEADYQRRHRIVGIVLALHIPVLAGFALFLHYGLVALALVTVPPAIAFLLGRLLKRHRRTASIITTAGLVYCSSALVELTRGSIEAHFHFFIIIGFIAFYQDWAPFLFNILFTVVSHGVGSFVAGSTVYNHAAGQNNPWLWSLIHGVAVLIACAAIMLFWRVTEEQQQQKTAMELKLVENELGRKQFTADLLVNLARRNQSMLYRQLDIINRLEESEQDPDSLAVLFELDHLATRVRRNAESLLVLSGEQPPRVWSHPVPLRDVVRAAIAETEDIGRVEFAVDERAAVAGHVVTDLTHIIAELTENAVHFSPPDTLVSIRTRPDREQPGSMLLSIEDWGIGMPPEELAAANELLADPPEIDLSVAQRLGFHTVARLARRHEIAISLVATPGSGITAVLSLPPGLFEQQERPEPALAGLPQPGKAEGSLHRANGRTGSLDRPTTTIPVTPLGSVAAGTSGPVPAPRPAAVPGTAPHTSPPLTLPPVPSSPAALFAGTDRPELRAADPGPEAAGPNGISTASWSGWWAPSQDGVPGTQPDGRQGGNEPRPGTHQGGNHQAAGHQGGNHQPAGGLPGRYQPAAHQAVTPHQPATHHGAGHPHQPGTHQPGTHQPGTHQPGTHQPGTHRQPPAQDPAVPAQQNGSPADEPASRTSSGLRRRVRGASLAPELQRASAAAPAPAPLPAADAAEAASALSRFQASRQAAQTAVEQRPAEQHSSRPADHRGNGTGNDQSEHSFGEDHRRAH